MTVSFSILLHNNNVNDIVSSSQRHFGMWYYRKSSHYTTLIDKRDKCIIKIGSSTLNFIISEEDMNEFNKQVNLIKEFIKEKFLNETIGIKYDSSIVKINFENIDGVRIIELQ